MDQLAICSDRFLLFRHAYSSSRKLSYYQVIQMALHFFRENFVYRLNQRQRSHGTMQMQGNLCQRD